jgi:hypothetical protein
VTAITNLCSRVLQLVNATDWFADGDPVRQPRGRLVQRDGTPNVEGIEKAVELAARRPCDGVLLLCDQDDDCPATWARAALADVQARVPWAPVMAVREYESWILAGYSAEVLGKHGISRPEGPRDAKGSLRRLYQGYRPALHQLEVTRALRLEVAWSQSDSFDKLVRSVAGLARVLTPMRP